MKKTVVIFYLFLFSSFSFANSFSVEDRSMEIRGREQFRDTLIWKEKNREGQSGSNQYIDVFHSSYHKQTKGKGQGVLWGTNSNLLRYPDIYLGVSFGYFRGKELAKDHEKKDKLRNYGVNAEIGYIKHRYLLLGGIGYTELRHTRNFEKRFREKEGHFFTEFGRLIPLSEKDYVYPFVGFSAQKIERESELPKNDVGLLYTRVWNDAWSSKIQGQYFYDWKSREKREKKDHYFGFLVSLSYRIYEDLEAQIQYRGKFQHERYEKTISLGFSHNF